MSATQLRDLIHRSIEDLPDEGLKHIAEYILFIRTQTFQPEILAQEAWSQHLKEAIYKFRDTELTHVEEEFVNYQNEYPVE